MYSPGNNYPMGRICLYFSLKIWIVFFFFFFFFLQIHVDYYDKKMETCLFHTPMLTNRKCERVMYVNGILLHNLSHNKSYTLMEEFHQDGCDMIVRKSSYHIQKRNYCDSFIMSRVQTSSSDAD